ncbi:hypothetical protein DYQ86_04410 [Acidobacteria bacterium AB60]|nr:hypothetical protein DYQ86_04410 [Acidobacteria bacterium AB60]
MGRYCTPGLFTHEQVEAWNGVLKRVHAKGGLMLAQLRHTGRASHISMREGAEPMSASVNPSYWQLETQLVSTQAGWVQPSPQRPLTVREIKQSSMTMPRRRGAPK